MIKTLTIKDIKMNNNVFLAPMAGYTDVGFRTLCKRYGAGLTYTEMVSAKALSMGSKKTEDLLVFLPEETPIAVQLFGNDKEAFRLAIESGKLDKFDIIDINMGCPAPKIVGNYEGSFLMTQLETAEEIIRTCVASTNKPVSVKFRSGWDALHINAVEFAQMCERAGASMITIHPRTKTQGYSGHSDWELIREVTKAVSIPVIASGDISSRTDAEYLVNECGASGVMIGRASLGKPEIFEEIIQGTTTNFSMEQKRQQIFTHIEILRKFYPEKFVYATMKKHILNYLKSFNGATKLKQKVCLAESLEEMLNILKTEA